MMVEQRLSVMCSIAGAHQGGACHTENCECDCHRKPVRFLGYSPNVDAPAFFNIVGYELWLAKTYDPTVKVSVLVERIFKSAQYPVTADFLKAFVDSVIMMTSEAWSLSRFEGELSRQQALPTPTLF